jgi:hypothetical protein
MLRDPSPGAIQRMKLKHVTEALDEATEDAQAAGSGQRG